MIPNENNLHERARRLIDAERIEGLAAADAKWLGAHLAECGACARFTASTSAAIVAMRSLSVALPPGLAANTQLRVQLRAEELKAREARNRGLIAGCALSWLVGVASAPLVWRLCAWIGAELDLPRVVWMLGFAFWWFVPAGAALGLILWQRDRLDREAANGTVGEDWRRR